MKGILTGKELADQLNKLNPGLSCMHFVSYPDYIRVTGATSRDININVPEGYTYNTATHRISKNVADGSGRAHYEVMFR